MWIPKASEVAAATARIDPVFLNTPLRRSAALDRQFNAELLFKDETGTPIRSFKGRGACNLLAQTPPSAGVVCASAGNFGQGVAWAARQHQMQLTVFASEFAVSSKVDAMRSLGATVVQVGHDYDAAKSVAAEYAKSEGLLYVEDGGHAAIAEGNGTIALELTDAVSEIDALLCPLGNGALAAGLGCWMRHRRPQAEIIAVCASGAPAMAVSVRSNTVIETAQAVTIADGIAIRVPIASAVHALQPLLDDVVEVSDDMIRRAMSLLCETFDLIVEPAGAAGFAALLSDPTRWSGKRVAIPLCGGNL